MCSVHHNVAEVARMKREVDTGDAHYSVGLVDEGLPDVALRQGLTHGDEPAKLHPDIGGAGLVEESELELAAMVLVRPARHCCTIISGLGRLAGLPLATMTGVISGIVATGEAEREMCQSQQRRGSYNERNSSKTLTDDDDKGRSVSTIISPWYYGADREKNMCVESIKQRIALA
jgi:hypothetical protein